MRIALTVFAFFLMIMGVVWMLQGVNILPGSFMTGQTKWAVYGALALISGIALLVYARRVGPG